MSSTFTDSYIPSVSSPNYTFGTGAGIGTVNASFVLVNNTNYTVYAQPGAVPPLSPITGVYLVPPRSTANLDVMGQSQLSVHWTGSYVYTGDYISVSLSSDSPQQLVTPGLPVPAPTIALANGGDYMIPPGAASTLQPTFAGNVFVGFQAMNYTPFTVLLTIPAPYGSYRVPPYTARDLDLRGLSGITLINLMWEGGVLYPNLPIGISYFNLGFYYSWYEAAPGQTVDMPISGLSASALTPPDLTGTYQSVTKVVGSGTSATVLNVGQNECMLVDGMVSITGATSGTTEGYVAVYAQNGLNGDSPGTNIVIGDVDLLTGSTSLVNQAYIRPTIVWGGSAASGSGNNLVLTSAIANTTWSRCRLRYRYL